MTMSLRTQEGTPQRCAACNKASAIESCESGGDGCCPGCGQLLGWFRQRISHHSGLDPERIALSSAFSTDLGAGSLDVVELVMELEEAFAITIPDHEADRIETVVDAIRYIDQHRRQ